MKRIVFWLKEPLSKNVIRVLRRKMYFHSVFVETVPESTDIEPLDDALYITSDWDLYKRLTDKGIRPVQLGFDTENIKMFEGCRYYITNPEEIPFECFSLYYKRLNDIPVEITRTKRLIIRETTESDVDDFYEMYKNSEMTRYTEPLYDDIEEEKKYVKEYREKVYNLESPGIWTLVRKKDGKIIGRAGVIGSVDYDSEIGFAIGCDFQKQGYAFEAVNRIKEIARKKYGIKEICALVMPGNSASQALLKKTGFERFSEMKKDGILYEVWKYDFIA